MAVKPDDPNKVSNHPWMPYDPSIPPRGGQGQVINNPTGGITPWAQALSKQLAGSGMGLPIGPDTAPRPTQPGPAQQRWDQTYTWKGAQQTPQNTLVFNQQRTATPYMNPVMTAHGNPPTFNTTPQTPTQAQAAQAQHASVRGPRQFVGSKFTDFPRFVQQMQGGQSQNAGLPTQQDYHAYMSNLFTWLQQLMSNRGGNLSLWMKQHPLPRLGQTQEVQDG